MSAPLDRDAINAIKDGIDEDLELDSREQARVFGPAIVATKSPEMIAALNDVMDK